PPPPRIRGDPASGRSQPGEYRYGDEHHLLRRRVSRTRFGPARSHGRGVRPLHERRARDGRGGRERMPVTQKLRCVIERLEAHGERVYTVALRPERLV